MSVNALDLLEIVGEAGDLAVRAAVAGRELLLREGDQLADGEVVEILADRVVFERKAEGPEASQREEKIEKKVEPYWPIRFLGTAGYAFNAPPGLRYQKEEDVIFRVDPTLTALEVKEKVREIVDRDPRLRGAVEADTGAWSRCMEAELIETTIDSKLRARPVREKKLSVQPLVESGTSPLGEPVWRPAAEGESMVRRMGLHATDWRWRVKGIRLGRTQLVLRLYAVAVRKSSHPGDPECGARDPERPESANRIRTIQRRIAIEVSAAEWVDAQFISPWLWSPLVAPVWLAVVLWRRKGRLFVRLSAFLVRR